MKVLESLNSDDDILAYFKNYNNLKNTMTDKQMIDMLKKDIGAALDLDLQLDFMREELENVEDYKYEMLKDLGNSKTDVVHSGHSLTSLIVSRLRERYPHRNCRNSYYQTTSS